MLLFEWVWHEELVVCHVSNLNLLVWRIPCIVLFLCCCCSNGIHNWLLLQFYFLGFYIASMDGDLGLGMVKFWPDTIRQLQFMRMWRSNPWAIICWSIVWKVTFSMLASARFVEKMLWLSTMHLRSIRSVSTSPAFWMLLITQLKARKVNCNFDCCLCLLWCRSWIQPFQAHGSSSFWWCGCINLFFFPYFVKQFSPADFVSRGEGYSCSPFGFFLKEWQC